MGFCSCKLLSKADHEALVTSFLGSDSIHEWNLLCLLDIYEQQQPITVEAFKALISDIIPFRGDGCPRQTSCCCTCTRRCRSRCLQDSLNRVYMWRKHLEYCKANGLPYNEALDLVVRSVDASKNAESIGYIVGDVISSSSNPKLKEYMTNAKLTTQEHPYRLDYAPQCETYQTKGSGKHRRVVDSNGAYIILHWPRTGLCPYCLPDVLCRGGRVR